MTILPLNSGSSAVVPAPPDRAGDPLVNAEEISRETLQPFQTPVVENVSTGREALHA